VPVTPLRLTEVAPNVHRLATTYWNWYLLEAGGRLTVLDGGLPGDWPEFVAALNKLGHSPADVDAVLITHHHPDHAGNAERLRSGGARVLAHRADAPYLRGEEQMSNLGVVKYLWHPWYVVYMVRQLAKGVTRTPAIAKLDDLHDGEVLDVPGRPRVIHAPGHTAGSCALLLENESLLFTGDALVTLDMTCRTFRCSRQSSPASLPHSSSCSTRNALRSETESPRSVTCTSVSPSASSATPTRNGSALPRRQASRRLASSPGVVTTMRPTFTLRTLLAARGDDLLNTADRKPGRGGDLAATHPGLGSPDDEPVAAIAGSLEVGCRPAKLSA
jgi:glyoxylase-like metal-dependent hydrolase (beta-lactamase superfamily II)